MDHPHDNQNRNALVFRLPERDDKSSKDQPVEDDDSFYDLTLEEMKKLYNDMLKQREISDKLLPRAKREEEEKKLRTPAPTYEKTVIRIEFPDQTLLQGEFKPEETVGNVKDFVREHIKEQGSGFELVTSPPREILLDDCRLIDLKLVPAAKLYVATSFGTNFQFKHGQTPVVSYESAQNAANDVRKQPEEQSSGHSFAKPTDSPSTTSGRTLPETSKKVPKWFKMKK